MPFTPGARYAVYFGTTGQSIDSGVPIVGDDGSQMLSVPVVVAGNLEGYPKGGSSDGYTQVAVNINPKFQAPTSFFSALYGSQVTVNAGLLETTHKPGDFYAVYGSSIQLVLDQTFPPLANYDDVMLTSLLIKRPVLPAGLMYYYNSLIEIESSNNGNAASGFASIVNRSIYIRGHSAAPAGGSVYNYGIELSLSNGSQAGGGSANNYGLVITGNGGAGGATNYAIRVLSTAQSYFAGPIIQKPPVSVLPAGNGELTVSATSNTQLTLRLKGTDGIVRSVVLTLA